MFETLKNAFKTKEIRVKIWITLALILVYRIGCYIPIPTFDIAAMQDATAFNSDFLSILNVITGGSMQNATLFALGVLPFINSSIIMQLLALVIPALEKLSKEGEEGRKKLTQITRIVAVVLAVVQAIGIVVAFKSYFLDVFSFEASADNPILTMALTIVILVAGSVMVMWLSERITEYGIGNGTSIIIFIGILSTAGTTMAESFKLVGNEWTYIWNILGFILLVVVIFVFIVFMDGAERRITVQYSKQIKGNKMYGGQTTYIPIRVNGSGVMPIIFASSLLMFPQMIIQLFFSDTSAATWYATYMGSGTAVYYVLLALFILGFSYFYAQIQFNPEDVSKNIQQYGGFIPGIRAGKPTSDFLKKINNRITFFGAVFLMCLSLIPTFLFRALAMGEGSWAAPALPFANSFSATGLLIVVSVALELNKQLESQIMMKHYKGFLR
ncbi:MAG TPA: preprotein translocase subunit SecY [Clostridiales bacterium]|nr:preprotein translocase subunit SecY [Clostridiales bacterium]HBP52687.1 preprotein translocase subunit SecY [Clostridiales bacterium]HBW05423.1 preprotein translocase subunit SecY [Clostridiales bacterium]HCH93069.1 preprotein translocase subunit SecY [Clostridiales bacterium]